MQSVRMSFAKEGRAVFISHLDLLRCVSRAFCRADIPVRYTQGFNPQPYLVFSPPLSLGYAGQAELCDFSIEDDALSMSCLLERLRAAMPEGVRPISCAPPLHGLGEITAADYRVELTLEEPCAVEWVQRVESCLTRPELLILKRSKRGEREVNLTQLIANLHVTAEKETTITLACRLPLTGENSLNPIYLVQALERELQELPLLDEAITRTGFFLEDGSPFC